VDHSTGHAAPDVLRAKPESSGFRDGRNDEVSRKANTSNQQNWLEVLERKGN